MDPTTDNPATTQGVANEGDATQQTAEPTTPTTPSDAGDTPSTTPSAEDSPTVTESAAAEPTEQTDSAMITRLRQETAEYAAVFKGLGLDPDSDYARKFKAGLVSKGELLAEIGVTAAPAQQPVAPQTEAKPTLSDIRQRVGTKIQSGGTVDQQDFMDMLEASETAQAATEKRYQAQENATTITQIKGSVNAVLVADETHSQLPDELKTIEQGFFWSSTDQMVGDVIRANPDKDDAQYLTPEAYEYYAKQNVANLNTLREQYIKIGMDRAIAGQLPRNPGAPVPLSPSTGASPTPSLVPPVTGKNMRQRALDYVANQGVV